MVLPLLIDTDMGADDALAVALALSASSCRVAGVVGVAGNVPLEQAVANVGRLLGAVNPPDWPLVGKGLSQADPDLLDARSVFGADGFGEAEVPSYPNLAVHGYGEVYGRAVERYGGALHMVALGPLTNLAELVGSQAALLARAGGLTIMGGAIWVRGNVGGMAEFNFYRDPAAARAVLSAGLRPTVVPLDVTRQVVFDESHLARLEASGTRVGEFLARVLPYPMQHGSELARGQMLIHDALAVGSVLWPELFLKTELGLDVELGGKWRGRCKPTVGSGGTRVSVLTAVDAVEFLQRLLEQLCQERFVV